MIEIWHEIMSYLTCIEKIDLIHEQIMFYVKIQWIIRLILSNMKIVMLEFMFYWIGKRYVICMYQSWHGGFPKYNLLCV